MAFVPTLKTSAESALKTAADSAGGLLQVQWGTPGSWVFIEAFGKSLETGQMWDSTNPISWMLDVMLTDLESRLIDAYGDPNP